MIAAASPSPSPVTTDAPAASRHSFYESTARRRLAAILDAGSFHEFLPPPERVMSPHLGALGVPAAFDDGAIIGAGRLDGKLVLVAAQEGNFIGGSVGEVHGAKIAGLLERARRGRPAAVLLLLESGGVRLHEANAGLIAVGGILRALLAARASGVRVLALVGGPFGCFGGCGIVARCCEAVIISEEGRLGLSGPEVIESGMGVEEFDSRDRPLVWRTTGGKHRFLLGEADRLVDDDVSSFRAAALDVLAAPAPVLDLETEQREHGRLDARLGEFGGCGDALDIWRALGVPGPEAVPILPVEMINELHDSHPAPSGEDSGREGSITAEPVGDEDHLGHLLNAIFPAGHDVWRVGEDSSASNRDPDEKPRDGCALVGVAQLQDGREAAILGTAYHAAVGVELALDLADAVLAVVRDHPGRPLVLLVDTRGQRLSRRDELLGINGFLAHLAKALELARQRGHRIISLVYSEAVSGGFLSFGLMADEVYALPTANVRVMALPAMARVTKQPLERLEELSRVSPVFGPGVENYVALGGVRALWPVDDGQLAGRLAARLAEDAPPAPSDAPETLTRQILARVLAAPLAEA